MTATRDPDRLLRAWLDLMPDEAPDRVVSAVLQATTAAPQVRVLPGPARWRPRSMNRLLLIAVTATLTLGLIGGAILYSGSLPSTTRPPSEPTATPVRATTVAGREVVAAAPEALRGDWQADVPVIPEINQQ